MENRIVKVVVKCVCCGNKKDIGIGEVPADEVPMCDKCFMPMVAIEAKTVKGEST